MEKKKIVIVGGGAGGFMAAINAAMAGKNNVEVIILEKMDRVGKKILATGNGRCNLTNINASPKYYHGKDIEFVKKVLEKYTVKDTIKFFEKLGVLCKTEDEGRVYPYGNQAAGVLDVLRLKAENLGIKEICDFEVESIKKQGDNFILVSKQGKKQLANKIIIATGGKASPNLGSDGSGYKLMASLGHTCTEVFPALVQIKSSSQYVKSLNGIKVSGTAKVVRGKKLLREEKGEILFTEYGLSGILIMQLSRIVGEHFINRNTKSEEISIVLDLMPDFDKERLFKIIQKRAKEQGWKPLESFFNGMFNKKIGQVVLKAAGVTPLSRLAETLNEKEIENIVNVVKKWSFTAIGVMNWSNAQVTAGGIKTSEFNSETMESRKVKGLYAVGEVLDVDGDCGGFNLQWAWSSGAIAGRSAAK